MYAIPISIVIEGSCGKNLLACLVGGTCCGALEETYVTQFPSERSGEACFCPTKYQCSIHQQKVEYVKHIKVHEPHRKARNKTTITVADSILLEPP